MCKALNDFGPAEDVSLSRAPTLDAELSTMDSPLEPGRVAPIYDWVMRAIGLNDHFLRASFNGLLSSSAILPPDERVIMYDACDEQEVRESVGVFRKRIDARRNTKPKKPDMQLSVCTPFDPNGFNFSKIKDDRERIMTVGLPSGPYEVLTNKFPLFHKHMLLVSKQLVPQQMTLNHLQAITHLLQSCSFCAYFNSWCASASVNHFHCHIIDEFPPVTEYPLVPGPTVNGTRTLSPSGFAGFCYVFTTAQVALVDEVIRAMQAANQPHNLCFTPRGHIYVFPKPLERPARSFELYPETVGGPELIGSFTVYRREDYDSITPAAVDELVRINTAPLPSRLLRLSGSGGVADDTIVPVAPSLPVMRSGVPASRSLDVWPIGLGLGKVPPAA